MSYRWGKRVFDIIQKYHCHIELTIQKTPLLCCHPPIIVSLWEPAVRCAEIEGICGVISALRSSNFTRGLVVSRDISQAERGDGFSNTSRVLVEHGHRTFSRHYQGDIDTFLHLSFGVRWDSDKYKRKHCQRHNGPRVLTL